MNIKEYESAESILLDIAAAIRARKRPSYTVGDEDVLMNFKRDAKMSGITPLQNWHTHFQKQVAAIARWVQTPDEKQSEPISERFADLINYCLLGYGLLVEMEDADADAVALRGYGRRALADETLTGVYDDPDLLAAPDGFFNDSDFHPV